ncbi:reverse transcriptase domain-containing protein [Tanacetum coccineum]
MSSTSSAVTYTSVYTDSEPGRVFWGANEELSDGGSPRVIVYGYDGLPMQPVAPPSPDYVPGHEHPPSPVEVPYIPEPKYPEYLVPSDDEVRMEDQPLPTDASPVALSPGYVADSNPEEDPKEDSKEDHADYPAGGGDDDEEPTDDDDDTDDEDEEPFEDEEDDEEEEERLASADSLAVPVIDHVPSAEDTEAFETDEAAPRPMPLPRRHTARMSVRPQTPVPLPSEAEVKRLLALPIPPPSPLTSLSSPLPQIPSPHLPPPVPTSLPIQLSSLPPLPASLYIPPVDCREDTSEAKLPPRKRLCLTALTPRYKRAEEVGNGIRDVWVDPSEAVEGTVQTTLEGVNDRVIELAVVQEQDTQDIYANNMPPRRTSAAARAAAATAAATAALMTVAAGTEGVVVLAQWFERMESVFHIRNCTVENQVKFATCTFLGNVLTWWNSHMKAVTQDVAYAMDWKTLKKIMTYKYCPRELALMCGKMFHEESEEVEKYVGGLPDMIRGNVISYQPKTMEKAIEFANDQMDQKVLTISERQAKQKRKIEFNAGNNQGYQRQNKRQDTGRAYAIRPSKKREYTGSLPLCTKCNYHHKGPCAPRTTQNAGTCYECGVQGHFKRDCPKLKNGNHGNQRGNDNAPAKVYVVGNAGTNPDSNVVMVP